VNFKEKKELGPICWRCRVCEVEKREVTYLIGTIPLYCSTNNKSFSQNTTIYSIM
jgi:hypothetical protein